MEPGEYNNCVAEISDALFRFALKSAGNRDDAHDIVQGAFEVLWQKKKDVERAKAKAFLFQVAYRQGIDIYRKKSRVKVGDVPEQTVQPAHADLKKTLDTALSLLDEQGRALILLRDYEGYNYDEIGKITGQTEAQVKVYVHRARKALKEYLVSIDFVI